MMKTKSSKRAILLSGLALLMCVSMLIGSTFAWFTDSVTSAGNKIVAGKLDVQLLLNTGNGYEDISDSTDPIFGSGSIAQDNNAATIWEPGKTQVAYLAIKNNGNLALKYTVALDVQNVSKDLYEVMEYTITPDAMYEELTSWDSTNGKSVVVGKQIVTETDTIMNPGDVHYFALSIHMNENAGDEYQDGEVNFDLTVLATQAGVESDDFDDQYDNDAPYSEPVSNATELAKALNNGISVIFEENITVTEVITVNGDVTIDLNGKELDASNMVDSKLGRPFHLTEGANLTVEATGATIKLGGHGFVNVLETTKTANITINGGNFIGTTQNGTLIRLRNGNENVNIVLNNVNYADASNNGYVVSTQGFEYTGRGTLTVNGGSYAGNYGFQIYGLNATLTDVTINTNGTAVEASGNNTSGLANVTLDNCNITVAPGVQVVNAPAAGVAASHGGTLNIKNSTINGNMKAVYFVYTSGGTINAENNDISNAVAEDGVYKNGADGSGVAGMIVVDGATVA